MSFTTIIKSTSSVCLYGNEGGDYEETTIEFSMEFNEDDCVEKCHKCHRNGECGFFEEKAIIYHNIKDIDDGEQVFEDFLKSLQG